MDKNKMGFEWIQILRITFFWTWFAFTVIQSSNIVITVEELPGSDQVGVIDTVLSIQYGLYYNSSVNDKVCTI